MFTLGCGGGSDSDSTSNDSPSVPTVPTATAEGFWVGNTSNGRKVSLAVLDGGQAWGFYTDNQDNLLGAFYGDTSTTGTRPYIIPSCN